MSEQTQHPGVPEPDEPRVDEDGGAAAPPDPADPSAGAAGRSDDDTDTGWGEVVDAEQQDREQWLRAERPPHWG
ncbi:MAG TPA: hypothetical protein VF661_07100 [Actinomycetales bacterium]|jgi:hypothetical protein